MSLNPYPWSDVFSKLEPHDKPKSIFPAVVLIIALFGLTSLVLDGGITALVFGEQTVVKELNVVFNESSSLNLNITSIGSLKVSGVLNGDGSARIYYQDANNSLFLAFDSGKFSDKKDSKKDDKTSLEFNDVCIDTCSLQMSDVKLLVVLRGENTSLTLFNITYAVAVPPGVVSALLIPDINLANSTTLNLSSYFVETNNHHLTFTTNVPDGVRAVLFDDVLFLSERESGIFNATITASNGVMTADSSFLIFVGEQTEVIVNQTVLNETVANQAIVSNSTSVTGVDVDDKIVAEFLKRRKVPVIILLKSPATQVLRSENVDKKVLLAQKKAEVDVVQEAVINDVNTAIPTAPIVQNNLITGAQVVDLQNVSNSTFAVTKQYDTINAIAAEISFEELEVLKQNPNVESVIYDIVLNVSLQDALPLIRVNDTQLLSTLSNESVMGNGQSVCIIDTGVDYTHPALVGKVLAGIDFVNNDADAMDDNSVSHGTHVSGIVAGVAPNAKIVPVKVCDSAGSCSASNILAGIDYCTNRSIDLNISVISGSLGDGGQYDASSCPDWFDSALQTADSFGIVSVYASGNNGYLNGVSYPSCSPFSVSVGATDKSDNVASFSNRGSRLDVFAPGVAITSTVRGGGYGALSGTSMATPFVSGEVALLKQVAKAQSQSLFLNSTVNILKNNGVAVGQWKRIDVFDAVKNILQIISPPALVLLSNNYDGENWTVVFNATAGELKVLPASGVILREVPDNNLTFNDVDFVSLQKNNAVVNVTLVDSGNHTLPYSIYLVKKRVEQIVKRLGELG